MSYSFVAAASVGIMMYARDLRPVSEQERVPITLDLLSSYAIAAGEMMRI
jgi:hypothetical protein